MARRQCIVMCRRSYQMIVVGPLHVGIQSSQSLAMFGRGRIGTARFDSTVTSVYRPYRGPRADCTATRSATSLGSCFGSSAWGVMRFHTVGD